MVIERIYIFSTPASRKTAAAASTVLPVDSKTLIRVVDTLPQKTLSDRERKNNLKKALKIGVDGVQWKRVLVVDDIYTTGSTVDAAAAVLREARTVFLTLSHILPPDCNRVYSVCVCGLVSV